MPMFSVREYQLGNIRHGGDWAEAASGSQQRATLASAAHSSVAPEVSEVSEASDVPSADSIYHTAVSP